MQVNSQIHSGKARYIKMKKNNLLKTQLEAMDDEALRALVLSLATSAGVSAEKTSVLTNNIPALRKALSKMNDEQISALINTLGKGAN